MSSIRPIIAGNSLAIALTIIVVLPITGIIAYVVTSPLDAWMTQLGTWLHETNNWSFSVLDTQERFAKIGFAIRSIAIALSLSFLYFWFSNWLNQGLARYLEGKQRFSKLSNPGFSLGRRWFFYCFFCLSLRSQH